MSYINIVKKNKKSYEGEGILLKLTQEGREELESRRFGVDGWDRGADQILCDLLEDHLCNGWEFIQPEEVGALTSANIISDEVTRDDNGNITKLGKVYWFPDYAIRLEIEELANNGEVFFPAAQEKKVKDSYPEGECPDCGENIPENTNDGDSCENCGHIFTQEKANA